MTNRGEPKNLISVGGVKRFRRWTILGVDVEVVNLVKDYATTHGYTTGKALKELVTKGSKGGR